MSLSRNSKGQFLPAHGFTKSRTYPIWKAMLARCNNPKCKEYRWYGARGIQVCDRWHNFENFLEDMGEKPEGMSLDRYPDPNGNYDPLNVRWATAKEQARNKRDTELITYMGKTQCIPDWAEEYGIPYKLLWKRIHMDQMPIEKALENINHSLTLITYNGKTQHLQAWANELGIKRETLARRIKQGWSLEKAFTTPVKAPL